MVNDSLFKELQKVIVEFLNVDNIVDIKEIDSGHINSTYLIIMPENHYILQKINTHVFYSPFGVMHNICEITEYIKEKLIYDGKDPNRAVLNIVKSRLGQTLVIKDNSYWRCMLYINNATTYEVIENEKMFEEVGHAIGDFQNLLDGFHTKILDETIKHFHDTPYRYDNFIDTIKLNKYDRVKKCLEEIEFIKNQSANFDYITKRIASKELPTRVTHNDTKLNNVMIDNDTGKALCLIDLDTVMAGSLLYDYGDALRIGASTAEEDETDLNKVHIDLKLIEAFNRGFLRKMKKSITINEVKGLYYGYLIITCEIAMRFLNDYLDGDHYFKIKYEEHNLNRAKNQIKLVKEIAENKKEINIIINKVLKELEYGEEYFIIG